MAGSVSSDIAHLLAIHGSGGGGEGARCLPRHAPILSALGLDPSDFERLDMYVALKGNDELLPSPMELIASANDFNCTLFLTKGGDRSPIEISLPIPIGSWFPNTTTIPKDMFLFSGSLHTFTTRPVQTSSRPDASGPGRVYDVRPSGNWFFDKKEDRYLVSGLQDGHGSDEVFDDLMAHVFPRPTPPFLASRLFGGLAAEVVLAAHFDLSKSRVHRVMKDDLPDDWRTILDQSKSRALKTARVEESADAITIHWIEPASVGLTRNAIGLAREIPVTASAYASRSDTCARLRKRAVSAGTFDSPFSRSGEGGLRTFEPVSTECRNLFHRGAMYQQVLMETPSNPINRHDWLSAGRIAIEATPDSENAGTRVTLAAHASFSDWKADWAVNLLRHLSDLPAVAEPPTEDASDRCVSGICYPDRQAMLAAVASLAPSIEASVVDGELVVHKVNRLLPLIAPEDGDNGCWVIENGQLGSAFGRDYAGTQHPKVPATWGVPHKSGLELDVLYERLTSMAKDGLLPLGIGVVRIPPSSDEGCGSIWLHYATPGPGTMWSALCRWHDGRLLHPMEEAVVSITPIKPRYPVVSITPVETQHMLSCRFVDDACALITPPNRLALGYKNAMQAVHGHVPSAALRGSRGLMTYTIGSSAPFEVLFGHGVAPADHAYLSKSCVELGLGSVAHVWTITGTVTPNCRPLPRAGAWVREGEIIAQFQSATESRVETKYAASDGVVIFSSAGCVQYMSIAEHQTGDKIALRGGGKCVATILPDNEIAQYASVNHQKNEFVPVGGIFDIGGLAKRNNFDVYADPAMKDRVDKETRNAIGEKIGNVAAYLSMFKNIKTSLAVGGDRFGEARQENKRMDWQSANANPSFLAHEIYKGTFGKRPWVFNPLVNAQVRATYHEMPSL